jgi:glycosyltransferase involved in cell wall biosynthesis
MNFTFSEHFRCPDSIAEIRTSDPSSGDTGYFRFGGDVVCYGQTNSGKPAVLVGETIHDALPAARLGDRKVSVPFDFDQVVQNLRCEFYAGYATEEETFFSPHPTVRSLYYWARPLMPVGFRKILQRMNLQGRTKNPFPRWPVDRTVDGLFETLMSLVIRSRGNSPVPFIWFWPEGKQAAFILTHDVEDEAGKAFCPKLMDIDDEYGFKASFQIVPENRYPVEPEFLQQFRDRSFEICVHDLNHDGNLYRERAEFRRRAQRINNYCKEFGAQGFRSGVLYRNLLWYGDYKFSYDMSVPNVAHLDPQGGGCCTVTPYFIGNILEIPVTMTQDYSLFHILHEHSIDLWKRQLRTIVNGHGLASVIIHPDYVIELRQQQMFRDLLGYVREMCAAENVWATVPARVNSWWRQRNEMKLISTPDGWQIVGEGSAAARVAYASLEGDSLVYSFNPPQDSVPVLSPVGAGIAVTRATEPVSSNHSNGVETPAASVSSNTMSTVPILAEATETLQPRPQSQSSRRPLRIAMVSYSFYETDNRVLRYASTLAKRGDHVDVFALRRTGKPAEEEMEGVHVHRLQGRILNEKNRFSYAWRICQFLARATAQVAKFELKEHYDLLHIHSVPDFMVFSGLLPKLRGTPVILDIHDILPEFYAGKFAAGDQSGFFRVMVGVERASCRFANHVIIANDIWRDRLLSRTLKADKCTVVLNSPDRSIFSRSGNRHPQDGQFLMLYPGSLNQHQGLDVAIRAFAKISKKAPQAEFHIYGDGPSKPQLLELIKTLGVESQVKMPSARSLQEIAQIMETASLGVVPKRKDNFGNEAFSTKILEFMAMGVPVVVSDTMIDKFYFDDSLVKFFTSGDEDDLARCMLEMIEHPEFRDRLIQNANRFVDLVDWTAKQHEYLELVDQLVAQGRS